MSFNLNRPPYFDDYKNESFGTNDSEHTKGFTQILFKPGYAVQARELTQLQSILKDQIDKFGSHVFKNGSVVIPGNSFADFSVRSVKIVTSITATQLEGLTLTSISTGLKAVVKKASNVSSIAPATVYVNYINTGTDGSTDFVDGETLNLSVAFNVNNVVVSSIQVAAENAVGPGAIAYIARGIFFINGSFVPVEKQSIIIGNTLTPTISVRLKVDEYIVTSEGDSTLLDPAQGSYNYAAPGADRLAVKLILVLADPSEPITSDLIEIMRYNEGVLEEHLRYSKYNELEKTFARRTYEESGNYIVNGLEVSVREHLRTGFNNGKYLSNSTPIAGDANKLIATISAGKAYVGGYGVDKISSFDIEVPKARETIETQINIVPDYGQYIYVASPNGTKLPVFRSKTLVNLFNFSGGTQIGTARVLTMDMQTQEVFKLYLTDISFGSGYDFHDLGYISYTAVGGSFTVLQKYDLSFLAGSSMTADNFVRGSGSTVARIHSFYQASSSLYIYKNSAVDTPVLGDVLIEYANSGGLIGAVTGNSAKNTNISLVQTKKNSNLIFDLAKTGIMDVTTDVSYKIFYEGTITGNGSITVGSNTTVDPIEVGNVFIMSESGTNYISPSIHATTTETTLTLTGLTGLHYVMFGCTKKNTTHKTKTLVLNHPETNKTPASIVYLTKADGLALNAVLDSSNVDITYMFDFDGGQTDYAYKLASIKLKPGYEVPTLTLSVYYDYFEHVEGTGDYFSVNSYSGVAYNSAYLQYRSRDSGNVYDLRNCLDFRPTVDSSNEFGASAIDSYIPQNDSRITLVANKYVPRIDSIICDASGKFNLLSGIASETPVRPRIAYGDMHLCDLRIPQYTFSAADVTINRIDNKVYTMRDIGVIDKRIKNIENYVSLSQTENATINYNILDAATGLDRYKSGYLVDTFNDINQIADVMNPEFSVAYDSGMITPQFDVIVTDLIPDNTTAITTMSVDGVSGGRGGVMSLPYTEVEMIKQPVSSKVTNVNPFAVFSWVGDMSISPSVDNWTTTNNLSTIFNSVTENVTETVFVDRPVFVTQLTNTGTGVLQQLVTPPTTPPDRLPITTPIVSVVPGGTMLSVPVTV